jgi:filamentous hemagglutinin family protein
MKTSLVSPAVSSPVIAIKADRPQSLKSVTIYFRGRKMVLMQRPQRRLSLLLCKMLRRSMQSLFGTLARALGAGALAALASVSMSAHAGIADTLPVNGVVQSGAATISTAGNQMTVKQATDKAIIDWQSFSIGSKAGVNFIQNNANSVALNRVIGNDPSRIMGSLTANGKLFLINAAGILVGKNAKIDVAGLTASTLNITDADFTDGNMNFAADAGKVIGNVKNKGEIDAKDGGSVYLIGANVENDGIINAPNGEVLLAAGRVVKLIDTTLPGVSIDVGGIAGKVTNLGKIMASAGTIGIGAALIDNSGVINASSVTKEGGRVFLRASQDLTTTSTSSINADGTTGGNVVLYSDQSANIDGDVSALGNVDGNGGVGGYVETSGKTSLSVMYVPRVGAGGEWYIDPYDVIIAADAAGGNPQVDNNVSSSGGGVITADGTSSLIHVGTINTQLDAGVNVTISTGTANDGGSEAGNITINGDANIAKNGGVASKLTLEANGSITISAGASIVDNTAGGLSLELDAGLNSDTGVSSGAIVNNGTITMGSGAMRTNAASFSNAGTLFLGGGTLTTSSNLDNVTNGTIAGTGFINLNNGAGTLTNESGIGGSGQGGVIIGADDNTFGILIIEGNYTQTSSGKLTIKVGNGGTGNGLASDQLRVTGTAAEGNVTLAGDLQINDLADATTPYAPQPGDKVAFLNYTGTRSGSFSSSSSTQVSSASTTILGNLFANYLLSLSSSGNDISLGYGDTGSFYFSGGAGNMNWTDIANWSTGAVPSSGSPVYIDIGSSAAPIQYEYNLAGTTTSTIDTLKIVSGELDVSSGTLNVNGVLSGDGTLTIENAASMSLNSGSSIANLNLHDSAVLNTSDLTVSNSFSQDGGSITINGSASFTQASGDLILGNILGFNAFTLQANSGAIGQQTGTTLRGNSIDATANGGITLNNSGNSISGSFAATNTGVGNIGFNNDGTNVLSLGTISNSATGGNVTISTAGELLATLGFAAANGKVDVTAAGGMSIGANGIVAHDIDLTSTDGSAININGRLQANASNGTVTVLSAGALTQGSNGNGGITAGGLVKLTSHRDMTISSNGISAHDIDLESDSGGDIIINGALAADTTSGTITLNSGNDISVFQNSCATVSMSGHDISLTTTGAGNIDIDGNLTADASAGGTITLHSAGTIDIESNSVVSASGMVSMTAVGDLTTEGAVSGSDISLTATGTGNIIVLGDLTADALTGTITLNSGSQLISGGYYGEGYYSNTISAGGLIDFTSVGPMTIGGSGITGGNIHLTTTGQDPDNPSDIDLYAPLSATGTLKMVSTAGIDEEWNGGNGAGITAGTVDATANNGNIYLAYDDSVNHIGTFTGTATNGGINVGNTGNLALGNVRADDGDIDIETVGTLTVNAGAVVTGLNVYLTTLAVPRQQEEEAFVEGSGDGDGSGNGDNGPTPVNADMTISGNVASTAGGIQLSSDGAIVLHGGLTATGGDSDDSDDSGVQLYSAGAITQDTGAAAGIHADTLYANAIKGITLNSSGNSVNEFTALNGNSVDGEIVGPSVDPAAGGDISLTNASATLTLDGTVNNKTANGNVFISNTGDIIGTVPEHGHDPVPNGTFANNKVMLTSINGNVTLALITAANLDVSAGGSISQEQSFADILTISGTMTATANTGISIDNDNNVTALNHIANFGATNSTSGDITLINVGDGDTLGAITNNGGNVNINNTGGLVTQDTIGASGGVTIATHSPLTINGAINAGGNVNLSAGDGSSTTDAVVVNGAISSVTGLLSVLGNTVAMNAVVNTPAGSPVFPGAQPVFGAGYALNPVVVVTPPPVITPPPDITPPPQSLPPIVTTANDQNIVSASDKAIGDIDLPPAPDVTHQTTAADSGDQTIGGDSGEFGGSKDDDSTSAKANKAPPFCS